ncbi:SPOR domain-containing protein [Rhodovibrionaceae bacterium A322]
MSQRGEGGPGLPGRQAPGTPQDADPLYQQQRDPFPEEAGEEEFYADSHSRYDMEMDPSYVEPSRSKLVPLLIAFVALLGFAGILLYAYNLTMGTGMPDGTIPVVEAPTGTEKTRPEDRGGMEVPNQDKVFLNDAEEGDKQGNLLPPSEDPAMPASGSQPAQDGGMTSSAGNQGTAKDVTLGSPPTLELSESEPVAPAQTQGMENLLKDVDKTVKTESEEVMAAVEKATETSEPPAAPVIPEPPKMADSQDTLTSANSESMTQTDDVQGTMSKDSAAMAPQDSASQMTDKEPVAEADTASQTTAAASSEVVKEAEASKDKKVESLLPKPETPAEPKKATPSTTSVAAVPSVPEPPKGAFIMQLAAVKSEAAAQSEWKRMQNKHKALLGAMPLLVQRADLGDRGIYYRIQTGPFPNKSTAQDLCLRLKQSGGDCIVKKR